MSFFAFIAQYYAERLHAYEQLDLIQCSEAALLDIAGEASDFSVLLFRPHFMLASEGYPMKVHKHQRLLTLPSPPHLPCGATNQGTYHDVWWVDAFAVT